MDFIVHEKLSADTIDIADWPINRVLLMNDANYPWLILVPRYEGLRDFHDVPREQEGLFLTEINHAARTLKAVTGATKMNTAALGNMVPQLHVHVIARFETDPAWPGPVWGQQPPVPYTEKAAELLIQRFLEAATKCEPGTKA